MRIDKIILIVLIILIVSATHLTLVSANYATSNTTVINTAPTVDIGLAPDDDPAAPGLQVINPNWETTNRTISITSTVSDMNGWEDLTGIVTAGITGPGIVGNSPVSLFYVHSTSVTDAVYTGVFNMSDHAEGDYAVAVTADDSGGLSGTGSENFTYLHIAADTTSPTVTDPVANPDLIIADGTGESELSVNVFDASGIYAVTIDLSRIGGDPEQSMNKIPGTDIYTTTTTAATGTTPDMYNLPVNAIDDSPNRNTNTDANIQITILPLEVATATYDFTTGAGLDRWAYGPQCQMYPPLDNNVPSKVFKSMQYEMIAADDEIMMVSGTSRRFFYAAHRFDFIIAEPENGIKEIDIMWNGKGEHDLGIDGAALYIWNFKTQSYEYLGRSTKVYTTLEGSINTDIGDYIEDSHLIILAEQNGPHLKFWRWTFCSRLGTDYVKMDVTYALQPGILFDVTSDTDNVPEVDI